MHKGHAGNTDQPTIPPPQQKIKIERTKKQNKGRNIILSKLLTILAKEKMNKQTSPSDP